MRTTLTLDDDLAHKLREISHLRRQSFKKTVNDAIRLGLNPQEPAEAEKKEWIRIEPHDGKFQPGIDLTKLNQLLDQMDVEEFIEKNPWVVSDGHS